MVERAEQRELIPQRIQLGSRPGRHGNVRETRIRTYDPPKNLVFRTDSSFLSPRQQEIMEEVIAGRSKKEIAWETVRSSSTIRNHLTEINNKLGQISPHLPRPIGRIETIVRLLVLGELVLIEHPAQPPAESVSSNNNSSSER